MIKVFTGIDEIDMLVIEELSTPELLRLEETNKGVRRYLTDAFWKKRFENKFHFIFNEPKNYKYLVAFLDNGLTLNENYKRAKKLYLYEITDIIRPKYLLNDIHISVDTLIDHKHDTYDNFVVSISYDYINFNEYVYIEDKINILSFNGDNEYYDKYGVLQHKGGFTTGMLLYQFAKLMPDTLYGEGDVFDGLAYIPDIGYYAGFLVTYN